MKQRRLFLAHAFLIVSIVLITVVGFDVAMRVIGYTPRISNPWYLETRDRVPNADLIMIRPDFVNDEFYKVDPERETIVTIGDSFTQGYPVSVQDSYPVNLERLLLQNGWDVNVVNMGWGPSGPDQHLRLLKDYLLPKFKPDIVIWEFYPNDIGDNIRQAVYEIEDGALIPLNGRAHWLYIRQKLYELTPLPSSVKEKSPVLLLLFKALEIFGRWVPGTTQAERRAWSTTKIRLAIEEMERLATSQDFQIYYVLVAPQPLYLKSTDMERWEHHWRIANYETLHGLLSGQPHFVDAWFGDNWISPNCRRIEATKMVTSAEFDIFADEARDPNPLGGRHFNEAGYLLLAKIVAACLLNDHRQR